jgi:TRAP-type C4-dicarboxylate transport system substrate-binding protein
MFRNLVTTLAAVGLIAGATSAHAATVFKFGTLAPQQSPWGKEFKRWAADVAKDTNGELTLDFQWNGQAGDEVLMVQKIRTGQLDGAPIDAIGLAQTGVVDALVFQLPGLFSSWPKLDAVRSALTPELDKQFEAKGFTVLGWGDVGAARTMSVGFEVRAPKDLQGKGCLFVSGDPVGPKLYSAIGGITPKALQVAEILPALTNGSINVLTAPPLVADQFQWTSHITHLSTLTAGYLIGATIVSSQRLAALPANLRAAMLNRGMEMQTRLTKSIRAADEVAFDRLKLSKTVYTPSDAEQKAWQDVLVRVAQQLRGTVFTPAFFDKVVRLADPPVKIPGVN